MEAIRDDSFLEEEEEQQIDTIIVEPPIPAPLDLDSELFTSEKSHKPVKYDQTAFDLPNTIQEPPFESTEAEVANVPLRHLSKEFIGQLEEIISQNKQLEAQLKDDSVQYEHIRRLTVKKPENEEPKIKLLTKDEIVQKRAEFQGGAEYPSLRKPKLAAVLEETKLEDDEMVDEMQEQKVAVGGLQKFDYSYASNWDIDEVHGNAVKQLLSFDYSVFDPEANTTQSEEDFVALFDQNFKILEASAQAQVLRDTVRQRNEQLKHRLTLKQRQILDMVPENQREQIQENFKSTFVAVKAMTLWEVESQIKDRGAFIIVDQQDQVEIRETKIIEEIEGLGPVEVTRQFLVHKVNAKQDALEDICQTYHSTEDDIREANGIAQDQQMELGAMTEILIPYKYQKLICQGAQTHAERQEESHTLLKQMVAQVIKGVETSRYKAAQKHWGVHHRPKKILKSDYSHEAQYYLEWNGYDYEAAMRAYRADVRVEMNKGKKPKGNSVDQCTVF